MSHRFIVNSLSDTSIRRTVVVCHFLLFCSHFTVSKLFQYYDHESDNSLTRTIGVGPDDVCLRDLTVCV